MYCSSVRELPLQFTTTVSIMISFSYLVNVRKIDVMLDSLKQLGIFFKYSRKWCRRFEDCVEQHNATFPKNKKIIKKNLKMSCERRLNIQVEKNRLLENSWATSTMSWKHYINRCLGRKQCYSGVGTFKINSKLYFQRCFSHNKIFLWFYPQIKLDIAGVIFLKPFKLSALQNKFYKMLEVTSTRHLLQFIIQW